MPVATVDPNTTVHKELKSAPPDGFVDLRALPFGLKLDRRSKATRMMMRMPTQQKNAPKEMVQEIESMDEMTVAHDFTYCIVDHNLTDANGVKLDFSNKMVLKLLDPKIGSEIEKYINELNEDEDEESLEDFMRRASLSSEEENGSLGTDGNETPITPSGRRGEELDEPRWVESWVYSEAQNWLQIAYLCDRLKILPQAGGLLDQDDNSITRLNGVLPLIDEYRNEEQEKAMKKNTEKNGS